MIPPRTGKVFEMSNTMFEISNTQVRGRSIRSGPAGESADKSAHSKGLPARSAPVLECADLSALCRDRRWVIIP